MIKTVYILLPLFVVAIVHASPYASADADADGKSSIIVPSIIITPPTILVISLGVNTQ
jgi:hypothetical protein